MCQRACHNASLSLHFYSSSATLTFLSNSAAISLGLERELVAVDFELAFLADEDRAARGPLVENEVQFQAVGIAHPYLAVRARGNRPRFDRAGSVHAQGPLNLVDPMGAPVGHFAAGQVPAASHPPELYGRHAAWFSHMSQSRPLGTGWAGNGCLGEGRDRCS